MQTAALTKGSEEFLSWLAVEKGRARNTLSSYRRDLSAYEASLSTVGRTPVDATSRDVESHLAKLRAHDLSSSSAARALSTLRGLHRFLLDEGLAAHDPTATLEAGRLPLRLPKALDPDDVARWLDGLAGGTPVERRDRALLELLYGTGARISEAVGLELSDLSVADGLVRLYGKGDKERLVPLGRKARAAMRAWLDAQGRDRLRPPRWKRRGDSEAVFLNARGGRLSRQGAFVIVRRSAEAAGLGDVSPHVLRHSCATHMLSGGADIRVVQELLGHASIATTQLYTKVSPEHLRSAYEAAHPRSGRVAANRSRSRRPA